MHNEFKFRNCKDTSARNISMWTTSLHGHIYLISPEQNRDYFISSLTYRGNDDEEE